MRTKRGVGMWSGCPKSNSAALDLTELFSHCLYYVGDVGSRGMPVPWHMHGWTCGQGHICEDSF